MHQKVLFSKLAYSNYLVGVDKKIAFKDLNGKYFSLVTGIANPEPLVSYLKANNASFEHFKYADHHFFNQEEISKFSKNELIVTTEKDFTKLSGRCENVFYLEVKHEFFDDGEKGLKEYIRSLMIDSQLYS
jgi:tetraacyldisaccharide 4'-kinase